MNFIAKIPVWQPRYWHREEGITNDSIIADETWEVLREGREEGRKEEGVDRGGSVEGGEEVQSVGGVGRYGQKGRRGGVMWRKGGGGCRVMEGGE